MAKIFETCNCFSFSIRCTYWRIHLLDGRDRLKVRKMIYQFNVYTEIHTVIHNDYDYAILVQNARKCIYMCVLISRFKLQNGSSILNAWIMKMRHLHRYIAGSKHLID